MTLSWSLRLKRQDDMISKYRKTLWIGILKDEDGYYKMLSCMAKFKTLYKFIKGLAHQDTRVVEKNAFFFFLGILLLFYFFKFI